MTERDPNDIDSNNGGKEYLKDQRLILDTLGRLEVAVGKLTDSHTDFKTETAVNFGKVQARITAVEVRSGIFGTIGGILSSAFIGTIAYLKGGKP